MTPVTGSPTDGWRRAAAEPADLPDSPDSLDLPTRLRAAAAEVIVERGLGGFSLREVARRADVSHAAPGYHFGDTAGLLTSLAVEGLETLHRETAAAAAAVPDDDAVGRLTAIGRAYVRVGQQYPAHMAVVFRPDLIDSNDPDMLECGPRAFGVVEAAVRAIADERNPDLDVGTGARLCWSAMQGLLQIHPKLVLLDELVGVAPRASDDLVADFVQLIVDGIG